MKEKQKLLSDISKDDRFTSFMKEATKENHNNEVKYLEKKLGYEFIPLDEQETAKAELVDTNSNDSCPNHNKPNENPLITDDYVIN